MILAERHDYSSTGTKAESTQQFRENFYDLKMQYYSTDIFLDLMVFVLRISGKQYSGTLSLPPLLVFREHKTSFAYNMKNLDASCYWGNGNGAFLSSEANACVTSELQCHQQQHQLFFSFMLVPQSS